MRERSITMTTAEQPKTNEQKTKQKVAKSAKLRLDDLTSKRDPKGGRSDGGGATVGRSDGGGATIGR
jgi:hypothetical protein